MGLARDVHLTPQRAFGPSSVYESGRTLLAGGQANPRTHIFGHSIILGGHFPLSRKDPKPVVDFILSHQR